MSCELHPSSRVCDLLLTVVAIPVFHHVDTRYTRIPIVTIIVTIYPALVQQSAPFVHSTISQLEDAAISFAAACFTSVIAASTRDARAMSSVSTVSFGAEFGRPLMGLTFNKSTQHCQTLSIQMLRHQIGGNDCPTDLLNPELLDFLLLLQPQVLGFHVFDGAASSAESPPSCCCSVCPD